MVGLCPGHRSDHRWEQAVGREAGCEVEDGEGIKKLEKDRCVFKGIRGRKWEVEGGRERKAENVKRRRSEDEKYKQGARGNKSEKYK